MCHIEAATYLLWGILEGQNRLNTKTQRKILFSHYKKEFSKTVFYNSGDDNQVNKFKKKQPGR